MITARIGINGGAALAEKLRALPASVQAEKLLAILMPAAETMRRRMGELAPRGPDRTRPDQPAGHLADSMTISQTGWMGNTEGRHRGRRMTPTEIGLAIGPDKEHYYGLFWEYGTVKFSAKAFMRPAFDGTARDSLQTIQEGIWAALEADAGGGGAA